MCVHLYVHVFVQANPSLFLNASLCPYVCSFENISVSLCSFVIMHACERVCVSEINGNDMQEGGLLLKPLVHYTLWTLQ